jgi:diguanylate cyclase (GGDEF)-like protein/PAS domain S-box-containing protein
MPHENLIAQINDTVIVSDEESGRIVDCNAHACDTLGYARAELLELTIFDITKTLAPGECWQAVRERFGRDGTRMVETRLRRRDGSLIVAEINAHLTKRGDRNYIVAVARELNESRRADSKLRLQDAALNAVANSIVITDREGLILWANPAFSSMTGYTLDEVIGRRPKDLVRSGVQSQEFYEVLWNTILSGQVWHGEVVNRRKDGSHYTEEMTITPVFSEERVITHFVAVKQDVSERKRSLLALEQSERTYRGIIDTIGEAVYILDKQGRFLDVNRGAEIMYGFSRHELVGKSPASVSAPGKNDLVLTMQAVARALSGAPQQIEFWGQRKNGSIFPKSVSLIRGDYFGDPVVIAVARDITAQKAAEEALRTSEARYRSLIANVPFPVVIVSADSGIPVFANRSAELLFETDFSAIERTKAVNFYVNAADRERIIGRQKRGEVVRGEEVQLRTATGRTIWVLMTSAMIEFDGEDSYAAVLIDVTQRKYEHTLTERSLSLLKATLESTADGILVVDKEGRWTEFNQRFAEMWNIPAEILRSGDDDAALDFVVTQLADPIVFIDKVRELYSHPAEKSFDTFRFKDGRTIERYSIPQYLNDTVVGRVWSFRDVSEKYQALESLKSSKAILQNIMDIAPASVFWKDLDSTYLGCNAAFARDANLENPEQIVGRNDFSMPWSVREAEGYRADDRDVMINDRPKLHIIETQQQADGSTIWLDTSKVPMKDKDGHIFGMLGLYQNITERIRAETELHLRESYLTSIVENQPGMVWLKDRGGRFLLVNSEFARTCNKSVSEVVGKTDFDFWPHDVAEKYVRDDAKVIADEMPLVIQEQIWHGDTAEWYETFKLPVRNHDGAVIGTTGFAHNITERMHSEQQLREAAAVMQNTHEGVMITDATPRILAVNQAFTTITGYEPDEVIGRNPNILNSGRQDRYFYEAMWDELLNSGYWQGELVNRRKSGETYSQFVTISSIRDAQQQPVRFIAVLADITQLKLSQVRLEFMASHDALTKLPNRTLAESRLRQELEQAHRHGYQLSVLFIDLDRFKQVNDSFGHLVGDELLCAVAQRLGARLREGDTLGRLGGDEFILICSPLQDKQDAAVIARDIVQSLGEPFKLSNRVEVYIGASVGISLYPDDGSSVLELTRNADAAMYLAKESGRSQFSFYTPALNANARMKLELENDLRHAIARDELSLHYQPKVDIRSGEICGAEALARWHKQGDVWVPPDLFIPIAEKSGVILAIGNWVIEQACAQVRVWADAGLADVTIAVNISANQFHSGKLVDFVRSALEKYRVPPNCLELELTESMLIHEPELGINTMLELKEVGVTLSLDDFGTGYSNFGYLRRFPIDRLKIDQSFVQGVVTRPEDAMIVDTIIGLARRMKLKVVGEGVELEEQLEYLRDNGCDELQGYYFSKPLPAAEFADLLLNWKKLSDD